MKAITPVIALVMLMLITVSIVGIAYTWFSGLFSSQTSSLFKILIVNRGEAIVTNLGTSILSSFTASVDGQTVTAYTASPIAPQGSGKVILRGLPSTNGKHELKLIGGSNVQTYSWEYPTIAIVREVGLGEGGWGAPTGDAAKTFLTNLGFAADFASADQVNSNPNAYDVIIFPHGEAFPMCGKSYVNTPSCKNNPDATWTRMKSFVQNGGILIGVWGAGWCYGYYWTGSAWTRDFSYDNCNRETEMGVGSYVDTNGYDHDALTSDGANVLAGIAVENLPKSSRAKNGLTTLVEVVHDASHAVKPSSDYGMGVKNYGKGIYYYTGAGSLFSNVAYAQTSWSSLMTWLFSQIKK